MRPISGDLARLESAKAHQSRLQSAIEIASTELVTGRLADPQKTQGISWRQAAEAVSAGYALDALRSANAEGRAKVSTVLSAFEAMSSETQSQALAFLDNDQLGSDLDRATLATGARAALGMVMDRLNVSYGGAFLLSGRASDTAPMPGEETLLSEVTTALSGATTVADVQAALDTFFDSPTGGFATGIYAGDDQGEATVVVDASGPRDIGVRADHNSVRSMLKGLVTGILAAENQLPLTDEDSRSLIGEAGATLLSAQDGLLAQMGTVGYLKELAHNADTHMSAEASLADVTLSDMVAADPFEAASRLEELQSQLEALYAISARANRVSLVNYLR